MATINHNGKEYEYDPHAVRVAVDCKVCWYSPIIGKIPLSNPQEDLEDMIYEIEKNEDFEEGTPWEGVVEPPVRVSLIRKYLEEDGGPPILEAFYPVYTGMVVYDGIEKEIKFFSDKSMEYWDQDSGFNEFMYEFLGKGGKIVGYDPYNLDCTIPIDDALDSECRFDIVNVCPVFQPYSLVYYDGTDGEAPAGWRIEPTEIPTDMAPVESVLPSIFDLYFSKYKFTCPDWDEDDTLRVIDVMIPPLSFAGIGSYMGNPEVFETADEVLRKELAREDDPTYELMPYGFGEYVGGWMDLLEAMPRACFRLLGWIDTIQHPAKDPEYLEIINTTASHLHYLFPDLYAEYLGPEATEGKHCRWDHTMRKPTPEEHESLDDEGEISRVCCECGGECDARHWHCFNCHRNREPEYDNHICHDCGIEQGVLNMIRKLMPTCDDCGVHCGPLDQWKDYTCNGRDSSGNVCGSTNFTSIAQGKLSDF